jgi:hypothetical protein
MVRLRPTKAVRILTFEEKKRVANFFILLVEIDLQKGVTRKRRTVKSTKTNTAQRAPASSKSKVGNKRKKTLKRLAKAQPKNNIDTTPVVLYVTNPAARSLWINVAGFVTYESEYMLLHTTFHIRIPFDIFSICSILS